LEVFETEKTNRLQAQKDKDEINKRISQIEINEAESLIGHKN
jgi:hypothetical protein